MIQFQFWADCYFVFVFKSSEGKSWNNLDKQVETQNVHDEDGVENITGSHKIQNTQQNFTARVS